MEKTSTVEVKPEETEQQEAVDADQSPELIAWFKANPTVQDTLNLDLEKKKEFILYYYNEEPNSDEMLSQMMDDAERLLDQEMKAGKGKAPYSELLILAIIAISKGKIMDELIEDVTKMYEERRKIINGKDIKDPGVIKITQINCQKLAQILQAKTLKQVYEEAKSRDFDLNIFMEIAAAYVISDLGSFVELERLYNFRKTTANKDKAFDVEKVKLYIRESLGISDRILQGDLDQGSIFIYPHLLADKLFNLTGFESEEVVYYIRKMVQTNTIDEELANLIVNEAYSVEKSKEVCYNTFDNQMMKMDQLAYDAYMRNLEEQAHANRDPLEDPSIKKMIEMGLMSKDDAIELIKKHNATPQRKPRLT